MAALIDSCTLVTLQSGEGRPADDANKQRQEEEGLGDDSEPEVNRQVYPTITFIISVLVLLYADSKYNGRLIFSNSNTLMSQEDEDDEEALAEKFAEAFNQVDIDSEGSILAEQLGAVLECLGMVRRYQSTNARSCSQHTEFVLGQLSVTAFYVHDQVVGQDELEEMIADMTDEKEGGSGVILLDDFVEVGQLLSFILGPKSSWMKPLSFRLRYQAGKAHATMNE